MPAVDAKRGPGPVRAGVLLTVATAAHLAAPGDVLRYVAYTAAAVIAAALMHRGIATFRPATPGWRRLEAGLWLHAGYGATLLAQALAAAAGREVLWLPVAEAVVDGSAHLMMIAAAVGFVAARRPGQDRAGLVDAATVLLAGGLLLWQWGESQGGLDRVLDVGRAGAWLVAVLMVATLVVGGRLYLTQRRPASFSLLVTAVVVALTGNFAMVAAPPGTSAPRWVESLWLSGVALAALAALLPDMRLLGEPELAGPGSLSARRFLALGSALLVNPALVVLVGAHGARHPGPLAAAVTVLTVLVLWRIGRLVADRALLQAQLVHQATHDGLTGLPNRAALLDHLHREVTTSWHSRALLFLDLDGFKPINDTLGHAAGDELLAAVAGRLRGALREQDLPARLGGDEFAVVLDTGGDPTSAEAAARRVLAAVNAPYRLSAGTASVTASIGIAHAAPARPAEELLQRADSAMYQAKRAGKSTYATATT